VLAANTLLRPVVNTINRKPLDVPSVEVTNTIHLIVESAHQKRVLTAVTDMLEQSRHPRMDWMCGPSPKMKSRSKPPWQRLPWMAMNSMPWWNVCWPCRR
jgi:putative Mg2+ transporter-C (MgtC) family protein